MVKIYVGAERKLWILPEALLCNHVEFFKSAFQSGFRESQDKVLELPEDDPMAFQLVLNDILGYRDQEDSDIEIEHLDGYAIQLVYCKAYVLADKIGRPDISARMCSSFISCMLVLSVFQPAPPRCVSPFAVKFAYQNTSEQTELRRSLTVVAVRILEKMVCATAKMFEEWNESASSHPGFLSDIMRYFRTIGSAPHQVPENFLYSHTPCVIHQKK